MVFALIILIRWMESYKSWTWKRYILKGPKLSMGQNMPSHVATLRTDAAE